MMRQVRRSKQGERDDRNHPAISPQPDVESARRGQREVDAFMKASTDTVPGVTASEHRKESGDATQLAPTEHQQGVTE